MVKMTILLKLCCILPILLISTFTDLPAQIHVVVGEFENKSDQFSLDLWEKAVPDMIQERLSDSPDLVILERRHLQTILEEKALSLSGLTEGDNAREIGDLLEADYVIYGSIHKSDDEFRIDVSIVRVGTGQVHSEKAVSPDDDHLPEMIELLSRNILHDLTGKGEYRSQMKIAGYPTGYFLAATAGLGLATILVHSHYRSSLDEYHDNTELGRFNDLYDKANQSYKASVLLGSLTGTALLGTVYCWIRNRSAREIYASRYPGREIRPWLATYGKNGVRIGAQIYF